MSALSDLRKRVEAATGPDREIDLLIGLTIDGWQIGNLIDGRFFPILGGTLVRDRSGNINVAVPGGMYPAPTESVDEALALVERVLPTWQIEQLSWEPIKGGKCICSIGNFGTADEYLCGISVEATTPPLAILSALLSALEPEPPHGR